MHLSTLTLAVTLAAAQAAALPASKLTTRADKAWYVTWQEQFNDLSGWTCDLGHNYPGGPWNWGTGQIERDTCDPSNVFASGGALFMMPQKSDTTGEWTSARIHSKQASQCKDGEKVWVEAEILLPTTQNQQGIWPAFWALGSNFFKDVKSWPSFGEFDILEVINGKPLTQSTGGLHCDVSPGGVCNEPSGITSQHNANVNRGDYNKYVMQIDRTTGNWKTESFTIQVGTPAVTTVTIRGGDLIARTKGGRDEAYAKTVWQNAMYGPFNLMLTIAIGGDYPGAPDSNTATGFTADMVVRNLKVWNWR